MNKWACFPPRTVNCTGPNCTGPASFQGYYIHLNGLTSLDVSTATALATCQVGSFNLRGLTLPSEEVMTALYAFTGTLNF
jgi:hypothetical protein